MIPATYDLNLYRGDTGRWQFKLWTDAANERFAITGVIDNSTWFDVDVSPGSSEGQLFGGNNPLYVLLGSPGAGSSSTNYVTQQQFAELQTQMAILMGALV